MNSVIFSSFRNKKKYILYSIIILIVSIIYSVFSIVSNYQYFILNNKIGSKVINREIIIKTDKDIDFLNLNINRNIYKDILGKYNNQEYIINEYYNIDNENERYELKDNEIVISYYTLKRLSLSEQDVINKNVNFIIKNKTYKLCVRGITNNNSKEIYVTNKLFNELKPELIGYVFEVDKYENVDKTINSLRTSGYNVDLLNDTGQNEIDDYKKSISLFNHVKNITIILLIVSIFILIIDIVNNEKENIILLRIIGYNKKNIIKIIFCRLFVLLEMVFMFNYLLLRIAYINISFISLNIIFESLILNIFLLLFSFVTIYLKITNIIIRKIYNNF